MKEFPITGVSYDIDRHPLVEGIQLMPVQTIEDAQMPGTHRLFVAMLRDVMKLLAIPPERVGERIRAEVEEARAWVESDSRSDVCDFVSICEALGTDPSYLRAKILQSRSPAIAA